MTTRREQKREGEGEYNDIIAVSVSVSEERYCGQRDNGIPISICYQTDLNR